MIPTWWRWTSGRRNTSLRSWFLCWLILNFTVHIFTEIEWSLVRDLGNSDATSTCPQAVDCRTSDFDLEAFDEGRGLQPGQCSQWFLPNANNFTCFSFQGFLHLLALACSRRLPRMCVPDFLHLTRTLRLGRLFRAASQALSAKLPWAVCQALCSAKLLPFQALRSF